MTPVRVAVAGAGNFGRNHLRNLRELPGVELVAAVDTDPDRATAAAEDYGCEALTDLNALRGRVDAAIVAVPTTAHAAAAVPLLEAGIDVLVEKPIAATLADAEKIAEAARGNGRIVQIGHLERFNPAVEALQSMVTLPLFFEVHRMSIFSQRSLDVDVVLDLMVHDLEVILSLVDEMPVEIRAAGLAILSQRVDIANVRLAFANGCVANLTASRVSTERIRKLRIFQPGQYISLDYQKQEAAVFTVGETVEPGSDVPTVAVSETEERRIDLDLLTPRKEEPLRAELQHFVDCVRTRSEPRVGPRSATRALAVALEILDRIKEHLDVVAGTLAAHHGTGRA